MLPEGEAAKRLSVVEGAASELARLRVERDEPIVAIGGGALGDAAGFLAATYLRGIPVIHVPTTLVAQIDSSIGGKTAVDLPEGKNLVGAFHQPAAIVIDVALLASLPERQRRAALGEAVKMAALGDERLFELLERHGEDDRGGRRRRRPSAATVAELVERCAWAKVEVVSADERERGPRGGPDHAQPRSLAGSRRGGRGWLRRAAPRRGGGVRVACRVPDRRRGRRDAAGAGQPDHVGCWIGSAWPSSPSPTRSTTVLDHLATDKKHDGGRLRWVLPTADGVEVRADMPDDVVARRAPASLLAAGTRDDDPRAGPAGPEPQPRRHPRARDLRPRDARRDP